MNKLVSSDVQSMNSLEISELVETEHRNVKVSIERLMQKGIIQHSSMTNLKKINNLGHKIKIGVYEFKGEQGKRDSIIVVAQLCPEFTARLVDRWQELEHQVAGNMIAMPNFSDPVEAARAWADQVEAKRLACKERDFAIETKAHISDKKTATAMATASVKSKQAEKLKELLGESKNYASIKAVEKKTGRKFAWKKLKDWCKENGLAIKKVADSNYEAVNIYHKDAWQAVYGIKLTVIFGN